MSKPTDIATLDEAVAALQRGELIALPTETVYGLGADATQPAAVKKIFAAKGRPEDHPLIVHLAKEAPLEPWVSVVPEAARQLIARFWPGPLTLILKKSSRIPDIVTGGQDSVGLRCPAHPLAQSLLAAFARVGSGLVAAPSANRFGHVSPTTAQHVRDEFGPLVGDSIYLLDGGACRVGIESTILDLSRLHQDGVPVLLRPGAVSREQIQQTIGILPLTREEYEQAKRETPRASGTLAAHYAPMTPLKLLSSTDLQKTVDAMLAAGQRVAVLAFTTKPQTPPSPVGVGVRNARPLLWISADTQADGYAHDLYAHLRTLDAGATAAILVEMPPQTSAWEAVNDRLTRAAAGSGARHRTSD